VQLPDWLSEQIVLGPIRLPFSILELVLELALPLLGVTLFVWFISFLLRRLVRSTELNDDTKVRVIRWIRLVARLLWTVALIGLVSRILGAELARWTATIFRILNQPFFSSGNTNISVVTLILVVPVFYLAGWLGRLSRTMVEHGILKRVNLDPARQFSILSIVRFTVMTLVVIIGLSIIGINLSSLAVIFGVLGIGLGFGLQDVVGNMFSGIVIIFSRPIKEGDRVLIGDIEGTVQHIKLIHTIVNTVTEETIIIPNGEITGNRVHNCSYDSPSIIVCNLVQVSYGIDLDRVGRVLVAAAMNNPYRLDGKEPTYQVWSFDDSGITVRLCTWIRDARERIPAFAWTNLEIWRAFRETGVEIPFPQMDLHVKGGTMPAPEAPVQGAPATDTGEPQS